MGMGAQLSVFSRPRGPVRTWGLGCNILCFLTCTASMVLPPRVIAAGGVHAGNRRAGAWRILAFSCGLVLVFLDLVQKH